MADYLRSVWRCRYFWSSLVLMDLRTRYRRSILGVGWSLLQPIAMTTILCLVFHTIFNEDIREYAPFLLAGLACWNFIISVTLHGCQCFFQGESYIRQYPAPMAIYPLRTALGGSIHFLLALFVVVGLALFMPRGERQAQAAKPAKTVTMPYVDDDFYIFCWSWGFDVEAPNTPINKALGINAPQERQPSAATAAAAGKKLSARALVGFMSLIPTVILLFFLGWSLSVLAGFANVFFQDTQHLVEVAFQLLFYATPIMYRGERLLGTKLAWLVHYNPLTIFLRLVREPVLEFHAPSLSTYVSACVIVLLVACGAMLTLHRLQKRLIFHL